MLKWPMFQLEIDYLDSMRIVAYAAETESMLSELEFSEEKIRLEVSQSTINRHGNGCIRFLYVFSYNPLWLSTSYVPPAMTGRSLAYRQGFLAASLPKWDNGDWKTIDGAYRAMESVEMVDLVCGVGCFFLV